MRILILPVLALLLISCAVGPTPERIGFDYPDAGLKFSPRRHVVSDTLRGDVATAENPPYVLLFPRTISQIEGPQTRLLTTGIVGIWDANLRATRPLYDEISDVLYSADITHNFTMTEERPIDLPWSGLVDTIGTLRIFKMESIEMDSAEDGSVQYTFAIIVEHYNNTIEFCWRDGSTEPPDDAKLETFFLWTHGMRFSEPEPAESQ